MDFLNTDYLKNGTDRQQRAFNSLAQHNVMTLLQAFQPILAGTIPINIDIESSDLDIICCWENQAEFVNHLLLHFGSKQNFLLTQTVINLHHTILANFELDNFHIEIFGQNIPTIQQSAYRHMLIEYEILQLNGETFRQQIIALKKQCIKTEPAFAMLLGLSGNPYEVLLHYNPCFP